MEFEEETALHTNKVDIWAMGCILYELATGTRPFKSDYAVISHVHSAKNIEVVLDNTFDADSIETITKHIVDMLQVKPASRPSASVLSKEFDCQWQLTRQNVQLSAIISSVSTLAVTEEIERAPATPQRSQVVAESSTLAVTTEAARMPSAPQHNIVGSNSRRNYAQNIPPHLIGLSLYVATEKADLEAVKALIIAKVDINANGGFYGNALQVAAVYGHEAVVRLLLEKGADVNTQGGPYGNALQAASRFGHKAVVRLLLEKGADVNAQGGHHGNALQVASRFGYEAVVRLLLEKGANVNAQGGLHGNALQAASEVGHKAVVRLLLKYGAKYR